ncbi:hypothetical protein MON38_20900 [Hymenobacter sp. DH14]|uniref:Uncharacterized protein n=1 Tax=Hymenobacter cyanobacteriorum TaxID=2926463 RepID=A0A9X1VIN6_9BACT|nr:hypothetical protein [Hymenobacter cyanobacteriorum]MCI1189889.1 hypothetical protein [Hymenobacter cyanobacteriorum]
MDATTRTATGCRRCTPPVTRTLEQFADLGDALLRFRRTFESFGATVRNNFVVGGLKVPTPLLSMVQKVFVNGTTALFAFVLRGVYPIAGKDGGPVFAVVLVVVSLGGIGHRMTVLVFQTPAPLVWMVFVLVKLKSFHRKWGLIEKYDLLVATGQYSTDKVRLINPRASALFVTQFHK